MLTRSFYTLFILLSVLIITACSDNSNNNKTDNVTDSIPKDSLNLDSLEQLYANNIMPLAADELFDDFFFNFAASGKLQRQRICFPLKVIENNKERLIKQAQWNTNHFYLKQGYCTGVFCKEIEENIVNDTTVRQAAVQHIDLVKKNVVNYHFVKLKGAWMLNNIVHTNINELNHAEFLNFYARFATDEKFQKQSLNTPVETTVPDPDSDFGFINGTFYPEQWNSFKPTVMPVDQMYNVVYGNNGLTKENNITHDNDILFIIRGVANGMTTTLKFVKKTKRWMLVSIGN